MSNLQILPIKSIKPNNGQIEGLPKNPRFIRDAKFEKLKESITNYPKMLEARSLLVYPYEDEYIIIGGNMRYRAMSELGYEEAPCYVIPQETDVETLKAYTIIDNGDFGQWDWDLLANEWDVQDLMNFGVDCNFLNHDSMENIDDFFEAVEAGEAQKNKDEEIKVIIPFEEKDLKEEVLDVLTEALVKFPNISIK